MRVQNSQYKALTNVFLLLLLIVLISLGCQSHNSNNDSDSSTSKNADSTATSRSSQIQPTTTYSSSSTESDNSEESEDEDADGSSEIEDGTYSATVEYYNPSTNYSTTYTLDVDVQDGQVVRINFPNGGYLDDDHITAADIDEDGNAHVEGEEGKTYDVHIDR